jgi:hypothetical protein
MANTLDDTLAAVTAEDAGADSLIAYNAGIQKQLADALAGVTVGPAAQAKIDAIFTQANTSAAKLAAAIAAPAA